MDFDFRGTWKTRNGATAVVRDWENDRWYGDVTRTYHNPPEVTMETYGHGWDDDGRSLEGDAGLDLAENLSVKWSSERAAAQNPPSSGGCFKKGECE